jgi:hypothetical protein
MASSDSVSREMIVSFSFGVYMVIVVCCFTVFLDNINTYPMYRQTELDAETFSLKTICHIDGIVSRPQEEKMSSSIIINTTFLISCELTSNGSSTKQQFEEWSVPVPFRENLVSNRYRNSIHSILIYASSLFLVKQHIFMLC